MLATKQLQFSPCTAIKPILLPYLLSDLRSDLPTDRYFQTKVSLYNTNLKYCIQAMVHLSDVVNLSIEFVKVDSRWASLRVKSSQVVARYTW